jgi:hypothetical protein
MQVASFSLAEVQYITGDIRYCLWRIIYSIRSSSSHLIMQLSSTRIGQNRPAESAGKTRECFWCHVTSFRELSGRRKWWVLAKTISRKHGLLTFGSKHLNSLDWAEEVSKFKRQKKCMQRLLRHLSNWLVYR